ncbi:MAG: hypothetical protein LAO19_04035 [Acidobacteriia bacterium]|nr:hypothetical protein [Terriglobia bacterium]
MSRLTTITYPDSTTSTFTYDSRGRRTSATDQNGKTTTYAYDTADRLTSVTDAASHVTYNGYDTEDNLTSIQDANSNTTAFTYDAFGRVTNTNFPSSLSETYAYDANSNLTSKTDRKGQTINYVYDELNRLTAKQYPDSTEVDYVYDLVGKITQVNDPTGTYAFAYDNMGLTFTPNSAHVIIRHPGRSPAWRWRLHRRRGCGKVGIPRRLRDSQAQWKSCFYFSTQRLFHSPFPHPVRARIPPASDIPDCCADALRYTPVATPRSSPVPRTDSRTSSLSNTLPASAR